jgi:electron transport complex protein RnfG
MKDIAHFAATLTLVALITAGSLAWVDKITKPKIVEQQENELNEALSSVLPDCIEGAIVPVKENDHILYYRGYMDKARTQLIGYAFLAEGKGYSSTIRTLVGIDTSYTIYAIKILSQQETPGLGSLCEEVRSGESKPWWQAQFTGKTAKGIAVDKDRGKIESITGATITSRAITNSIAEGVDRLFEHPNVNNTNE